MDKTDKATFYYEKHLARLKHYNENHREEIREAARESFKKLKADPVLYEAYKIKKRDKMREKALKKKLEEEKEIENKPIYLSQKYLQQLIEINAKFFNK